VRTLEKMSGHTRVYRRGAVYYHRAAVPQDIVATYGTRPTTNCGRGNRTKLKATLQSITDGKAPSTWLASGTKISEKRCRHSNAP